MTKWLGNVLRLRPGEGGLVLTLGLLLFANSIALEVAEVVSVTGFLAEVGIQNILLVWIIDMVLIILFTGVQSFIVDRWNRIAIIRAMLFVLALVYLGVRLLFTFGVPGFISYAFLYVLGDLQWLFFPLVFWVLANDVYDVAQGKRLFPLMAAFGFAGQIVGLGLSGLAPQILAARGVSSIELLSLNAFIYLLAYMLAMGGIRNVSLRQTAQKTETMVETLTEGWGFIKEVPAFRYLTVLLIMMGLGLTIVEYHFLGIANATFTDTDNFQTFYGFYRLGVAILAILVGTLLSSRIIEKINLKNTFAIFPITMLISASGLMLMPGLAAAAGWRAFARLVNMTIDESSRKAFFALIPEERRGRVSIFMESYLPAIGTIIGALVIGAVLLIAGLRPDADYSIIYLAVTAVAAVISVWAVFQMRKVYDNSLFNWRLKRRQRRADVLDKLQF